VTLVDETWLRSTEPPWVRLVSTSTAELDGYVYWSRSETLKPFVLRVLRGQRMLTKDALLNEFAAALQFPWYFGHNWDAFDECLADLGWLPGAGYAFFITGAEDILRDADDRNRQIFVSCVELAARRWCMPSAPQVRPPRPFHIVLQCDGPVEIVSTRLSLKDAAQ
jgi:hypothetical protein